MISWLNNILTSKFLKIKKQEKMPFPSDSNTHPKFIHLF